MLYALLAHGPQEQAAKATEAAAADHEEVGSPCPLEQRPRMYRLPGSVHRLGPRSRHRPPSRGRLRSFLGHLSSAPSPAADRAQPAREAPGSGMSMRRRLREWRFEREPRGPPRPERARSLTNRRRPRRRDHPLVPSVSLIVRAPVGVVGDGTVSTQRVSAVDSLIQGGAGTAGEPGPKVTCSTVESPKRAARNIGNMATGGADRGNALPVAYSPPVGVVKG